MKNKIKLIVIIVMVAIIGFGMTGCGGGGGGNGINFSVKNDTTNPITNIRVFDYDLSIGSFGEKVGDAKYDSGTINIAANAKHEFKVSGLNSISETVYFQLEVTSSDGTATIATSNGDWYTAAFIFYIDTSMSGKAWLKRE